MLNEEALVPLIGPFGSADQLWILQDIFLLPPWLMLVFCPRWKYTSKIVWSIILFWALVYTMCMITFTITTKPIEGGDFGTLQGIVSLWQDPNVVYMGWVHYLSFDMLVAQGIVSDSQQHFNLSYWQHLVIMGPILGVTLMAGPMGLFIYMALKYTLLEKIKGKVEKTA